MVGVIVSTSLLLSVILALGATSGYISERAGIINIGINGFMTIGALLYAIVSQYTDSSGWMQIPCALTAMVGTAIFSFLHSFACIKLRANQTISGTAINLLASGVTLFILNVVFKKGNVGLKIGTDYLGADQNLESPAHFLGILVFIGIFLVIVAYLVMRFTRFGLRLRASGENPHALAAQGIKVSKIRYEAIFISGLFAGLAGAVFAQDISSFFGDVNGYGWLAIAILIAGQWKIPLIVIASVVFGFLTSMSRTGLIGMPPVFAENSNLFKALPFVISLLALVFTSRFSAAPRAAGIPYEQNQR